jgi:hypothetical protein
MPDVVATTISTMLINTGNLNAITISSSAIYGKYYGDGSQLTGISGGGGGGLSYIPPFLSTTTLSTNLLTASNISTNSISTNNLYIGTNTAQFGNGVNVTGGEIQVQAGTIRIAGSSTLLDLWNYCSITQTSGNLTINSLSSINITSTSNINITSISTNNISTSHVYAYQYHGDGSLLTGVASGFVGTATSHLNMSSYTLSNSSGILNLAGTSGIQILDTTTTCNVQFTVNSGNNNMTITAPTSNISFNLGGNTGILSIDMSGNLLWNGGTVSVTAPPPPA